MPVTFSAQQDRSPVAGASHQGGPGAKPGLWPGAARIPRSTARPQPPGELHGEWGAAAGRSLCKDPAGELLLAVTGTLSVLSLARWPDARPIPTATSRSPSTCPRCQRCTEELEERCWGSSFLGRGVGK